MDSYKIIANAYVITCDPQNRGGRYNLLIRNDRIIEVSERHDIFTSLHPSAKIIDASNKLIIPGFVNGHFHSESVLLSARTDDLHCSLWKTDLRIQECIKGLLDTLNKDDMRNIYLMAYFRHLKSGTTCVGEFSLPFAEKEFAHMLHCIERTEVKSVVALQTWDQISTAGALTGGRHRFLVNVGKEEDFTVYSFENLLRAARELKVPLLAHIGEQRSDVDLIKRTFQKNILAVLQDFTALRPDTVFVHLNHLSAQETAALAEAGASAVICARSAAFKRTGYPSLRHLARERIPLAVGTDWGRVDMLEELKFIYQLHLLISGIPELSPLQLIRMGTINGALAIGLSHETGSIEGGKKADLAFFSLDDMWLPVVSQYADAELLSSLLVNHLTSRDISDVMINGEFYIARGEVMTMAEEEIVEGFRATHSKFFPNDANETLLPPLTEFDAASARPVPKILPFVNIGRMSQLPEEGFESGFRVAKKPPTVIEMKPDNVSTPPPALAAPQKDAPRTKQESSKETWMTFGEDEDF